MDRGLAEAMRQERAAAGSDRWDEVWEGTYMMAPLPNIEHQELVGAFVDVLREVVPRSRGIVLPGTNVSDRETGWEFNYRCPDVAVYLSESRAKNCRTHWCGGPDFAVEIVSPDDMVRDKIPFYGKVAMRELLIVDRDPWRLEMLRLSGKKLKSVGISSVKRGRSLPSRVLPLGFRLIGGKLRPMIEVTRSTDDKIWTV
ncbi:MAG TPA: Uma2 family endonuclease [Lacipirellulaceae bacterium]